MIITILYFLISLQTVTEEIKLQNTKMEQAFNSGDMKTVAKFYADDAVILSFMGDEVIGRENIDQYWMGIQNPVEWQLDVIEVSQNEKDIYDNPYYQALENKPPSWRAQGYEFDDQENLVYQLGRSTLKSERNGKVNTSEVDFILIWQATDEGYKILLDAYSW